MKNNLFLIVGEDEKLINFSLFDILKNIEYNENNKISYDLCFDKFMDVIEEASMVSLFEPKKVIIVNNFSIDIINDDELIYLEKYIDSGNEDVYMIFICSKIDARKKSYKLFKDKFRIIDISDVNTDDIKKYVSDEVKDNKFKMDDRCVEYFLSKTGNDINNINLELRKLFIYKEDSKIINVDDIDKLIFDNIDNVMYEWTNAILDNDYDKVKFMYDKFKLDNVSIDYLITSVGNSFRVCLIMKLLNRKGMSNFEISKVVGKKEFFVKKSLDRLYSWTIDELMSCINKLALIDRNIKSGLGNISEFELFLFCKDY